MIKENLKLVIWSNQLYKAIKMMCIWSLKHQVSFLRIVICNFKINKYKKLIKIII